MPQPSKAKTSAASTRKSGVVVASTADTADSKKDSPQRWPVVVVCILLGLAVWAVFGQTLNYGFVNYDNNLYVYENLKIQAGVSLKGIVWAFTHRFVDQWCPLTAISHMVDCEIYGLYAGGHHLTNVLLHITTVILLLLVLRNMTGSLWRSAFVAAVFAIHPLRVESVAWVSERKDVLSGLFFVLTIWAYVRYAQMQAQSSKLKAQENLQVQVPNRAERQWRIGDWKFERPVGFGFWALSLIFFALGLLSKPMLVTLPFLLLLLDWWPLRRIQFGSETDLKAHGGFKRLLVEKIPFVVLVAAISVVTMFAEKGVHHIEVVSLPWRIANAVVAYAIYLKQMIYPLGLAVIYPHPENHLPLWAIGVSALVLLIISAGVLVGCRKRPYLLVGWLWYLGMLVPVIGLVLVGSAAHADRYTYLPQIGIYIMMGWGAAELSRSWRYRRVVFGAACVAILAGLGILAHAQTRYWSDSISLWTHALDCTTDNYVAHCNLGVTLADQGNLDEAITHYERAIKIKPEYAEAHYNLGVTLAAQGKTDEAAKEYEKALNFKPNYIDAHNNLGNALIAQNRPEEAIQHYRRAIQLEANQAKAHYNLGNALGRLGRLDEAIQSYKRALEINPDYADAHYNWANRLANQGKLDEAIEHYQQAIKIRPDLIEAQLNLANKLVLQKKYDESARHYEAAIRLKPDYAEAHNNFGAALAGQQKLEEAIQHYQKALELKPDYAQACANLGNALAMKGKSDEAMQYLHEALNLAVAQSNAPLARAILTRLEAHQTGSSKTQPAP